MVIWTRDKESFVSMAMKAGNLVDEEDHWGREVEVASRLDEASGEGRHQEMAQSQVDPPDEVAEFESRSDQEFEFWRLHWTGATLVWPVALKEGICQNYKSVDSLSFIFPYDIYTLPNQVTLAK